MAIDKIIEGAVRQVSAAIERAAPDIEGLRQHLLDRADGSAAAIADGTFDDPWLSVADERTIAFSPTTVDGQPLLTNGKTTSFYPRGEVAGALAAFRTEVERGSYDDQLTSRGAPTVSPKIEGEQLPIDADNGSLSTGGGRTDADETDTRHTEHVGEPTTPAKNI